MSDIEVKEDGSFQKWILSRLSQKPSGEVYQGTVSSGTIAKRRAKNKVAKASRKANR